ncbi:condensation domain-containing protein [Streptomyces sp. NPDC050400]|uniref:condensation domain-containing protein n=1 Tax=Streptomyces sp. NPDC050400 TaxID=3365610 RepID=UPI0037B68A4B
MDTALRERLAGLSPERRAELLARLRAKEAVRGRGELPGPIAPLPPGTTAPLSYAQQRMWFLDQLMDHQAIYHTPVVLRLRGPLDVAALGRAVTGLTARHAVLRTRFARDRQIVEEPPESVPLPLEDLPGLDADGRERALREHVARAAREPFDLAAAAPLRARLWRFAPDDHVFALILHHAVVDDWSIPLLVGELSRDYLAGPDGTDLPASAPGVQYTDYAAWQRDRIAGPVGERQAEYWARQLAGAVPTALPADRPRPRKPTWAGETITGVALPPRLAQALTAAHEGPLLTVLATALNAVLSRWAESTDITVGTVFAGRVRPELEPLIGFFPNTLVLRTSTAGDPSLSTLLERTADVVTDAHRHQELPFDQVVARQRPTRSGARNPLFQVALVTSESRVEGFTLGDLRVESCDVPLGTSRFDLTLSAARTSTHALELTAEYSTELFDRARVECLLADLRTVLESMVTAPGTPLSALVLSGPLPGVPSTAAPDDTERPPAPAPGSWSALGQLITGLWRAALDVPEARADDDFFTLGGGSLQAAALVVEIRERTGIALDLGEFLHRPTLTALVTAADDALAATRPHRPAADAEPADLVVPLLPGDPGRAPVFLFHASSGSSLAYAALCRELPAGIPYYGISVPGLDEGELPASIGEMAEAYADAVLRVAPEGPYRLVGWSVGGGLAHATAVRLRRRGARVTLLAMLDTQRPPMLDEAPDAALLRAMFAENLALTAGVDPPAGSVEELAALDESEQADRVIDALVESGLVPPGSADLMRRRMEVFRAIISTAAVWRPEQYDGRIDLLLTEDSPASTADDWAAWTSGPVIMRRVPGDHYGMMRPPQVAELGRTLGALLDQESM